MKSLETQERLQITPRDAVADAMMVAYGFYLLRDLEQMSRDPVNIDVYADAEMQVLLRDVTKDKCRQNSVTVLAFLTEKYPKLFQNMLILESVADFAYPLRHEWSWHDYFLVQGEDQIWYAGSPANYEVCERQGRLTNLISGNLRQVLDEVRRVEAGAWPGVYDIETALEYQNGRTVLEGNYGDGKLSALCVRYELGEIGAERLEYLMGAKSQTLRPGSEWLRNHVQRD